MTVSSKRRVRSSDVMSRSNETRRGLTTSGAKLESLSAAGIELLGTAPLLDMSAATPLLQARKLLSVDEKSIGYALR